LTREDALELGRKYAEAAGRQPPTNAFFLEEQRRWLLEQEPRSSPLWDYWIIDDATGELVESGAMKA